MKIEGGEINMNMEILLKEFKTYKVDIEGRNSNSVDLYINHIKEFCFNIWNLFLIFHILFTIFFFN